jgi:hypothetical protein
LELQRAADLEIGDTAGLEARGGDMGDGGEQGHRLRLLFKAVSRTTVRDELLQTSTTALKSNIWRAVVEVCSNSAGTAADQHFLISVH